MNHVIIVPYGVSEKVAAFLREGKTGQILLNVNRGRIESYELKEHCRVPSQDTLAQNPPSVR